MDRYLIEKCLVEHCSATLASMKSANLFNMTFADDTDCLLYTSPSPRDCS